MAFVWLVLTLVMAAATDGTWSSHEYDYGELSEESPMGDAGSCVQIGLPNVMGMGKCLGNSLNLCQAEHDMKHANVMKIASCTVSAIFKNLAPASAFATLRHFLVTFVARVSGVLAKLLDTFLGRLSADSPVSDSLCHGEIKVGFPSSYGKCLNGTVKVCNIGSKIDASVAKSLADANMCFIKETISKLPKEEVHIMICTTLHGAKSVFSSFESLGGKKIYKKLYKKLCK